MNDQPKPLTPEFQKLGFKREADQPKPATGSSGGDFTAWDGSLTPPSATKPTGEWTQRGYCVYDDNGVLFPCPTADDARSAVSFHNAALAAAYKEGHDDGYAEAGNGLGY